MSHQGGKTNVRIQLPIPYFCAFYFPVFDAWPIQPGDPIISVTCPCLGTHPCYNDFKFTRCKWIFYFLWSVSPLPCWYPSPIGCLNGAANVVVFCLPIDRRLGGSLQSHQGWNWSHLWTYDIQLTLLVRAYLFHKYHGIYRAPMIMMATPVP